MWLMATISGYADVEYELDTPPPTTCVTLGLSFLNL